MNYPDRYVRHRNYLGELTPIFSELDRKDGTFKLHRQDGSDTGLFK